MLHKNSRNQIEETQKGRERGVRRVSLSPGNAKKPFKRRKAWRIMYSVAIMNGRRFGNASPPFIILLLHHHLFLLLLTAARLLCCFFVTPFFAPWHVYTRGLHQACLSSLEGKMTSRPFLAGQREEMQPHTPVRFLVLPFCSRAGRHCRVDLRGLRKFPSKETKKKRKHRLSFLSSSPASLDLSDLPRFLMPSPIPVLPLVFKSLCRKTRTLMDSGIRRNSRRFKEIAVWDRTCDRGVSVENFSRTSPSGDCILTRNSLGEREPRKIKLYHNEKYKRCMKTLFTNFYEFFRELTVYFLDKILCLYIFA